MLSDWYVVVQGEHAAIVSLEDLLRASTEHSLARDDMSGEWRLRSSQVAGIIDHESAWQVLRELLVRLADVAAAASFTRLRLSPGALGRTRPDGRVDLYVHPETISLRVRGFPPTIVVSGQPQPESQATRLLRLADANDAIRLAVHFLNAEENWYNLYKAFETIRDANGGKLGVIRNGWATKRDIDRFSNTANNYSAVGDAARHAPKGYKPPKTAMTLVEADDWVRALLSKWVGSLP